VACCRRVEGLLADARKRRALDLLERAADAEATAAELAELPTLFDAGEREPACVAVAHAALSLINPAVAADATRDALFAAHYAAKAAARAAVPGWDSAHDSDEVPEGMREAGLAARAAEYLAQSHLLRDIFGNSFRHSLPDTAAAPWDDAAAVRLAREVYAERRFAELPALGRLLEAAGCPRRELVKHCRLGKAHARGCWVLDALLRKS
jgi:hypothetical protein